MASRVDRAVAAASREVAEIVGQSYSRRSMTITKFGRHADGYLHARVTVNGGATLYVHRKFGSWFCPGVERGRSVLKEVLQPFSFSLAEKARQFERAEREALKEAHNAANPGGEDHGESHVVGAGGDPPVPDDRAP
jgi:hypothetical protein